MSVTYAVLQSLSKGFSRSYSVVKGSYDGPGLINSLKAANKE